MKKIIVLILSLMLFGCFEKKCDCDSPEEWDTIDDVAFCEGKMEVKNDLPYDIYVFYRTCGMEDNREFVPSGEKTKLTNLMEMESIIVIVVHVDTAIGRTSKEVRSVQWWQYWRVNSFTFYY